MGPTNAWPSTEWGTLPMLPVSTFTVGGGLEREVETGWDYKLGVGKDV